MAVLLVSIAKPAQGAATPEKAKSADAFVDSVGVNTHINYFGTPYDTKFTTLRDKLSAAGIRHIRDKAHIHSSQGWNDFVYGRYKELASLGIKATLHADPRPNVNAGLETVDKAKIAKVAEMAGPSLEAFEGPNEMDISGDSNWAEKVRNYQRDLYNSVKGNSSTANVPVLGPSLAHASNASKLGNLEDYFDYGNMHPYPGGRYPSAVLDSYDIANTRKVSPTKPFMPTETGYHQASNANDGHPAVSEAAAGKYMPRLYLEYFNRGIPRTFAYEAFDLYPEPELKDSANHFGLLRNDGSEKPAYTSMKNLIGLLNDPGSSFTPGSLDYSWSGDTSNIHRTLLQKRDGTFYLVLWQEVSSYDTSAKRDISVSPKQVTLSFGQPIEKAATYLPKDSATATKEYTSSTTQLSVSVPDHPLVVELKPSGGDGSNDDGSSGGGPGMTCATGQYMADYYNNLTLDGTPTLQRCEDNIDNDWGIGGSPSSEIASNFSARWTGNHEFEAGNYTFSTTADDGIRIYVDDELVIDQWKDQGATTYTSDRTMSAGEHEVKVEYYDSAAHAVAKVDWQKTGDDTGSSNKAPTIKDVSPAPNSKTKDRTPRIAATVQDDQTDLAKSNITLSINGTNKNFTYDPAKDRLSYTSERLSPGTHVVKVVAQDEHGLSQTYTWSFRVTGKKQKR